VSVQVIRVALADAVALIEAAWAPGEATG